MTRILIIEDNIKTANYLLTALKENYFVADIACDGQEGTFLATENNYEVIILDIMLPIIDGWTILKDIRQNNKHTYILLLTACDSVSERVRGLELGLSLTIMNPVLVNMKFKYPAMEKKCYMLILYYLNVPSVISCQTR